MSQVVIRAPLFAPVGRSGGVFAALTAGELATLLTEFVARTGLGEGDIDDVILGQGYANGEAPALGRIAAPGVGVGVPGLQIDRRCGSGLAAVPYARAQTRCPDGDHSRRRPSPPSGPARAPRQAGAEQRIETTRFRGS
jgi:acetyl-CoA C-acetyltransferase